MLTELRREFGSLAGAQPDYSCFQNAIHNTSLGIVAGFNDVAIFGVNTNKGVHAYISKGKNVYSYGLTTLTKEYPELNFKQIFQLDGVDLTTKLLMFSIQAVQDIYNYNLILRRLETNVPGITNIVKNKLII